MPDQESNDVADESLTVIAVDDTTDDTKPITDGSGTNETDSKAQPG